MLQKGDRVKVTNWGEMYSQYYSFFDNKVVIPTSVIARYAFDDDSNCRERKYSDDNIYEVLYVSASDSIAVITRADCTSSKVFLVGIGGLKQLPKRMTKEEIEKELGYPIEIV